MKKRKIIITLFIILGAIAIILGCILLKKNKESEKKIEILDATYICAEALEKFYEDEKFEYYFTCMKSGSVYVKFANSNKMLVVTALEEELVTIEELLDAGLKVHKIEK